MPENGSNFFFSFTTIVDQVTEYYYGYLSVFVYGSNPTTIITTRLTFETKGAIVMKHKSVNLSPVSKCTHTHKHTSLIRACYSE